MKDQRAHRISLQQDYDTLVLEAQLLGKEVTDNRTELELKISDCAVKTEEYATDIQHRREALHKKKSEVNRLKWL